MLRRLFIRDFAIVDRLELDFAAGFGALTGETGAGKSILVDALALALGERADSGTVRAGCERAEVAAEFDVPAGSAIEAWLRAHDYDVEDGCLLRRIVDAGGKSRAYLNGMPTTLAQLREAADLLADIHGQHAHHLLLRAEAQRQLLDGHAGLAELAREVAARHQEWRRLREARLEAEKSGAAAARECEALDWQVRELQALAFDPAQWLEDNQEHRRLAHAAGLLEGTAAALGLLDADETAATALVDQAAARLRPLAEVDEALREPAELVEAARIQLGEAAHALSRYRERLDLNPERLAELEARIAAVTGVARKHRVAADELPELLARFEARLAELSLSADPEALARREQEARAAYDAVAERLSAGRARAAADLSKAVTEAMQQLAMVGGRFAVALEPLADPAAYGRENVEFRVAANAGQPMGALARIASGGELSRIGLAIQVIASCAGQAATLVFDEVDVGIGGGVAEVVGRLLRRLGRERQVLCVTHLPQVAAQADWQWSIAKETSAESTVSRVAVLDAEARVAEIARMLGGVKITETSRRHARELIESASRAD